MNEHTYIKCSLVSSYTCPNTVYWYIHFSVLCALFCMYDNCSSSVSLKRTVEKCTSLQYTSINEKNLESLMQHMYVTKYTQPCGHAVHP